MQVTLYYGHDPMCSWCWGFSNTYSRLLQALPETISVKRLLGGLAPDTTEPMPMEMQKHLRSNWQRIQEKIPGVEFNYDFWDSCKPRRSTYPACRAVIAARKQAESNDKLMTRAIQEAYYLHAQNPSDDATLVSLAEKIAIDSKQFYHYLNSEETIEKLQDEIRQSRDMFAESFPSLVLEVKSNEATRAFHDIKLDYNNYETMMNEILSYVHG